MLRLFFVSFFLLPLLQIHASVLLSRGFTFGLWRLLKRGLFLLKWKLRCKISKPTGFSPAVSAINFFPWTEQRWRAGLSPAVFFCNHRRDHQAEKWFPAPRFVKCTSENQHYPVPSCAQVSPEPDVWFCLIDQPQTTTALLRCDSRIDGHIVWQCVFHQGYERSVYLAPC